MVRRILVQAPMVVLAAACWLGTLRAGLLGSMFCVAAVTAGLFLGRYVAVRLSQVDSGSRTFIVLTGLLLLLGGYFVSCGAALAVDLIHQAIVLAGGPRLSLPERAASSVTTAVVFMGFGTLSLPCSGVACLWLLRKWRRPGITGIHGMGLFDAIGRPASAVFDLTWENGLASAKVALRQVTHGPLMLGLLALYGMAASSLLFGSTGIIGFVTAVMFLATAAFRLVRPPRLRT